MHAILVKSTLVFFYTYLFAAVALNVVGLPGNWVLVATALVVKLIPWFGDYSWWVVVAAVGLAAVGEAIESLLGMVVVAKKGGTRWGVMGSFAGGLAGVMLGVPVIPPLGSVLFGFVGAFAGAVAAEYMREQKAEPAFRVGYWAFVGRTLAMVGKGAAGLGIVWLLVSQTWG